MAIMYVLCIIIVHHGCITIVHTCDDKMGALVYALLYIALRAYAYFIRSDMAIYCDDVLRIA